MLKSGYERPTMVLPTLRHRFKNEMDVQDFIGATLRRRGLCVGVRINPGGVRSLRHAIKELVPCQPEIDIAYLDTSENSMTGLEVKYLIYRDGRASAPFYEGMGEALALSLYGFDYVILCHVFDPDFPDELMEMYIGFARTLLRGSHVGLATLDGDEILAIKRPTDNPFLTDNRVLCARNCIMGYLKVGKT